MSFKNMMSAMNISASGLSAERMRMEVLANNIANSNSTRSPDGGPFRRQDVIFSAVLDQRLGAGVMKPGYLGGVRVDGVENDMSDFNRIYNPGHPDADGEGYVLMPNIQLPVEMINLISASRAYEANMKALQSFKQMADQALALARA